MNTRFTSNAAALFLFSVLLILPIDKTSSATTDDDITDFHIARRFRLFAGVAAPVGEFASIDPSNVNSGFAYPGFIGGLEFTSEVTRNFGFALGGMMSVHAQNVSEYQTRIRQWYWEPETRVFSWLLGGLYLDADLSESMNIYTTTEIGMVYGNYPNLKFTDLYDESATFTAPSRFSVAYKVALGVIFKNYDFNIGFLYSAPEFEPVYEYRTQQTTYPPEKKPIKAILFTLGYDI